MSENHGFAQKVCLVCESCGTLQSSAYSSVRSEPNSAAQSSRPDFDVNRRVVRSFVANGKGYPAIEQFCMATGMHVMSSSTYFAKCKSLSEAGQVSTMSSLAEVRAKVAAAYMELYPNPEDGIISKDGSIDIAVSFDGSWQTRGFSSKTGVACVVDLLTGYVIDYVVQQRLRQGSIGIVWSTQANSNC